MNLTAEQVEGIKSELKRIGGNLNLSDEQKTKLHERLTSAAEKLHEYKQSHPNAIPGTTSSKQSYLTKPNCARGWSASLPRNS